MNVNITDEIRAAVYRELADEIDDHSMLTAENLLKRADEKERDRLKERIYQSIKILRELVENVGEWADQEVRDTVDGIIDGLESDALAAAEKERDRLREAAIRLCGASARLILAAPSHGPLWHGSQEVKDLQEALLSDELKSLMDAPHTTETKGE